MKKTKEEILKEYHTLENKYENLKYKVSDYQKDLSVILNGGINTLYGFSNRPETMSWMEIAGRVGGLMALVLEYQKLRRVDQIDELSRSVDQKIEKLQELTKTK